MLVICQPNDNMLEIRLRRPEAGEPTLGQIVKASLTEHTFFGSAGATARCDHLDRRIGVSRASSTLPVTLIESRFNSFDLLTEFGNLRVYFILKTMGIHKSLSIPSTCTAVGSHR